MKRIMTTQEAQVSKDRAVRFATNVLDDPDLADQIADESIEDWTDRKGITIENPERERRTMPTNKELTMRIQELEDELSDYQDREAQLLEIYGVEDESDEEETDEDEE